MDAKTISRRTSLALILCAIAGSILFLTSIFLPINGENFVAVEYINSVFGGIFLLSAIYLVYAVLRYQTKLSRMRRGTALLPVLLLVAIWGYDKIYTPDYDYGAVYEGSGEIHDVEINFGWANVPFRILRNGQENWDMLNHRKLPDEVTVGWTEESKTRHSQVVILKGKVPKIPQNCQILFKILPDKVEVKVTKR